MIKAQAELAPGCSREAGARLRGLPRTLISPKIGGRLPAALPWPPGMSGEPLEGLMGGVAAAHVPAGVFVSFVHAALLTLGVLENCI